MPRSSAPAPAARMIGVDVARFLAIVGMIAAHLVPVAGMLAEPGSTAESAGRITDALTAGIAAPLFAVLGGVSTVFATRRLLRSGRAGAAIGAVAVRGALLIVIGLVLGLIETPVAIVLAYYGAAMLIVAPLVAVRSWLLGALALVLGVAGGPVNAALRVDMEPWPPGDQITFEGFGQDPGGTLGALLLTGEYPAITWVAYLLVGVLIGRLLTAAARRGALGRAAGLLAGAGAVAAVAGQLVSNAAVAAASAAASTAAGTLPPGLAAFAGVAPDEFAEYVTSSTLGAPLAPELWAQLIATPHSGSPVDVLRTVGIAASVIGLLVLLCDVLRTGGRPGTRPPGAVLGAVRAAGAAPLTVYTLHIVATGLLLEPALADPSAFFGDGLPWWAAGLGAFALQLAGVLAIGALLAALGRRGPLEAFVSGAVRLVVRGGDRERAGGTSAG